MEEKSLDEILRSGNTIIPEIQREYVWGLNEHVLNKFLTDIYENRNSKVINIGFLYSYRPYQCSNDIFLIDGQQRFTTLVLLAFYCAIKENNKKLFSELLKLDQPTRAFSYRVRILTENFLFDLFRNINLFKTSDIQKEIEDEKWFLDAYKKDTSIKAILNALKAIQKFYDKNAISYKSVISISFWYFNVGETSQGEELYITMNSRGECLTSSEQIKPLLFEKLKSVEEKNAYGKKWDEWEEHFYEIKKQIPNFSIDKVDLIMNRFIQTILQIENQTEKTFANNKNEFSPDEIDKINLYVLEKYFTALDTIEREIANFDSQLLTCLYGDKQENKYLYPFAFLVKAISVSPKIETKELIRIYQIIRNAIRRNKGNGIVNYVPMLRLLNDYNGSDFYAFILNNQKESLEKVLDAHELDKVKLIKYSGAIESFENKFWKAQAHEIFNGNISPLITWASPDDVFDVILFDKYFEIFNKLFHDNLEYKELDITRRALLTIELAEYPRCFRGNINYSFCWEYSDWKTLINSNVDKIGLFLKELFDQEDIYKVQKEMIKNFSGEKKYAEFVEIPELLSYCKQKNIQYHGNLGWTLISQHKATTYANLKAYRLYLDLKNTQWRDWIIKFREHDRSCVFFKSQKSTTEINIYYSGGENFYLHLFKRDNQEVQNYFSNVASLLNLTFIEGRYESKQMSKEDMKSLLESLMIKVEVF